MAWLKVWKMLLQLPGVREVFLAACQFASAQERVQARRSQPEPRTLGPSVQGWPPPRCCAGALRREIAIVYGEFIKTDRLRAADESQGHAGLESPIINDLISAKPWVLEKSLDMEAS